MVVSGQPRELYHLNPGTALQNDRYVLGLAVGSGGFGITYEAWDNALNTRVAIKEYYPGSIVHRAPGGCEVEVHDEKMRAEYDTNLTRFLAEARNMAMFRDNPNIVDVYSYFRENNTAYIVMEFLDGISLGDYLRQESGRLPYEQALEIIYPVLDALSDVHSKGIIHRDISPDNIYLCKGSSIKVIDFGAARLADTDRGRTKSIMLKIGYAPPEQYSGKSIQNASADIYAVCATLYRMITGKLPDDSVNRLVEDKVEPPDMIENSVPRWLSNVIMKGMAVESELRFQSAAELKDALRKEVSVQSPAEVKTHRARVRIFAVVSAAVFIIVVSIAMVVLVSRPDPDILSSRTVTIWIPYDEASETADDVQEMVRDMSTGFLQDQPRVTLEIECIPETEYSARLEAALGTDDMPVVYASDDVSDAVLANAAPVDSVFDYIESDEYYFLGEYKDELNGKLPLGFNVPVMYVGFRSDADIGSVTLDSFEQLEVVSGGSYYISPKYYQMSLNSLAGDGVYIDGSPVDGRAKNRIKECDANSAKLGCSTDEKAMDAFADEKLLYYVASVMEAGDFKEKATGRYEIRPFGTDKVCAEFEDCFSVDTDATEAEKEAVYVWLSYMLSEDAQKVYHIENKHSVPLNKNAYEEFVTVDVAYEMIDGYMDKIVFYAERHN